MQFVKRFYLLLFSVLAIVVKITLRYNFTYNLVFQLNKYLFMPLNKDIEKERSISRLFNLCLLSSKNTYQRPFIAVFIVLLILFFNDGFAQNSYRRHIVIAYDNSIAANDINTTNPIPGILENLLLNYSQLDIQNGNESNLIADRKKGKLFFDPEKDEISFMQFNDQLSFIKNTNITWSGFKSDKKKLGLVDTIPDFLTEVFSATMNPSQVTVPNLVFPLVLNSIDGSTFAEEYVLIVLSSTSVPPTDYNNTDLSNLKSITGSNPLFNNIQQQADLLSKQYQRKDYFNFQFSDGGIFGYYLSPKNVEPASAQTAVYIDGEIELSQNGFNSSDFIISPFELNYPQSENLKPIQIFLTVSRQDENNNTVIFNEIVLTRLDNEEWSSDYVKDDIFFPKSLDNLMKYNYSNTTYTIPHLKIDLADLNYNKDFNGLKLNFTIKSHAKISDNNALGLVFFIEKIVPFSNVSYKSNTTPLMIISFFVFVIVVVFVFVFKGRPQGIMLIQTPFTDSYESTDYAENGKGRFRTPYREWTEKEDKKGRITINVKGRLTYASINKFYNWREKVGFPLLIRPLHEIKAEGFFGFVESNGLQAGVKDPIELTENYGLDSKKRRYKDFEFKVVLRKEDSFVVKKPIYLNFSVEVCSKVSHILYKSYVLQSELKYEFYLGPNLGNVWVGVDPGTTGSCIATATCADDITIEKIAEHAKISPSVINIDVSNLSVVDYSYQDLKAASEFGARADARKETETRKKFVSLKKLLGYRDTFILKIYQGRKISVTSTQLSSLLIEGVIDEHKDYINNNMSTPKFKAFCSLDGKYSPKRLAIAIPNNFTSTKIQHLKESIDGIPTYKFDEIRFIYEAEAILMHHLNSKNANIEAQESKDGEIVFVFDMGGATINATLARIEKRLKEGDVIYNLEIIGKLGYGIGGDTIDYAFIKWLYSFKSYYPTLSSSDPFKDDENAKVFRKNLKKAILNIKIEMIKAYENSKSQQILTRDTLANFAGLNLEIMRDADGKVDLKDPFMNLLNKNGDNIITSDIFKTLVWDNITKIVEDVLSLCGKTSISNLHTLLLCGRSAKFPLVKETVMNSLKTKSSFHPKIVDYDLHEAKSAVALGACYYGIQKESVHLRNIFNNAVFGVKQTMNPNNFVFHRLIDAGTEFMPGNNGNDTHISKAKVITQEKKFSFDGLRVNYYQIMGVDANEILSRNEQHKFTRIASIPVQSPIERIEVSVTEKDRVTCRVTDANHDTWLGDAVVRDSEITDSNDEHYTFFIK